jgi:hypothetical protein
MTLDPAILAGLSVRVDVTNYVRIISRVHAAALWAWDLVALVSQARETGFICFIWHRI